MVFVKLITFVQGLGGASTQVFSVVEYVCVSKTFTRFMYGINHIKNVNETCKSGLFYAYFRMPYGTERRYCKISILNIKGVESYQNLHSRVAAEL